MASKCGNKEEDLKNHRNQKLQHSSGIEATVMALSQPAGPSSQSRKRRHPGNSSPDAEVVALSPKSLMATNRFVCEVCNKGFQREQNLQLHLRGHNLPWKLKERTTNEARKKVYICPELGCVHHDPSKALGDLTGIKKHFGRKHAEKTMSCGKCNKKYAVEADLKAHHKICGIKGFKCECGATFSRRYMFRIHRSSCDALDGEVARHPTKLSEPRSSMPPSILPIVSNPGSFSLGSAADSLILGNSQSLSSPVLGLGAFQPIQPPNVHKLSLPRASQFSGIHGFPSNIFPTNMFNFGFDGGVDLNIAENDLDLNINNSFSDFMMNAEPFRDGMSFGGRGGGCSTFQKIYNNLNVGGETYASGGFGRDMEYSRDQMNAQYGGMMYNVKNADGMLVGEVNNNVLVEPQMNVQSEFSDKPTRYCFGMGNGMNSLTGGGMENDRKGNGMGTNSSDNQATTSAQAGSFVPRSCNGF